MNRDRVVVHEAKVPSTACRYRGRARTSSGLSADRVRDGADGADALPRFDRPQEAGRPAGHSGDQIRGLAVVFGVRLPRALSPAFIKQALRASEGIPGLSAAMRGLVAARAAVLGAVVAIRRAARSNDS
jgi:hypothetical protein